MTTGLWETDDYEKPVAVTSDRQSLPPPQKNVRGCVTTKTVYCFLGPWGIAKEKKKNMGATNST